MHAAWLKYKAATKKMLQIVGLAAPTSDLHLLLATRLMLLCHGGPLQHSEQTAPGEINGQQTAASPALGLALEPSSDTATAGAKQSELISTRALVIGILKDRYGPDISNPEELQHLVTAVQQSAITVGI